MKMYLMPWQTVLLQVVHVDGTVEVVQFPCLSVSEVQEEENAEAGRLLVDYLFELPESKVKKTNKEIIQWSAD